MGGKKQGNEYEEKILELKQAITGWVSYFGTADMGKLVKSLDEWLRTGQPPE